MPKAHTASMRGPYAFIFFVALILVAVMAEKGVAHPLGNFTVNHFARIEIGAKRVKIRYVVDMAEIAAFQEMQAAGIKFGDQPSGSNLEGYLEQTVEDFADGIFLTVDGNRIRLHPTAKTISFPTGAGGLFTLRIECELEIALTLENTSAARRIRFEDSNHRDRIGWREIVVLPTSGVTIFDSTASGSAVTDELKTYPEDMLSAPLSERTAEFSITNGSVPAGSAALLTRDGRKFGPARDRFAELISVPELTPAVALLGLLIAAALGGLHALSPGHGKTVVGAYLVGSRGTARHAAFLGLTVTITHTIGVFALGLVTLFASQYVVPERLFPILSMISGALVLTVGLTILIRRLRAALNQSTSSEINHTHTHDGHAHRHVGSLVGHPHHVEEHTHGDHDEALSLTHSHGGAAHTHLPPGADGSHVTWRSLFALGVSGGLLPCPSALVVLLSAISLQRVGYGLVLIVAFSMGLAATLTGVGLAFVYVGRFMKLSHRSNRFARALPIFSAFVITCVGAAICYESLAQAGLDVGKAFAGLISVFNHSAAQDASVSTASLLGLGFILGLKHAVEADHLAAVSTIVSERKSILGSSLVGGLWGVGHTVSLLIAGVVVILLRVEISERTSLALELCVALMLVALGASALAKLLRGARVHTHSHRHGARKHLHPHLHDRSHETEGHWHHGDRPGARPIFVGMAHGFAGSAALMLLVLSTIPSPLAGLGYIAVFGIGSVGGMLVMSALVSLPLRFTATRFARANLTLRWLTGIFSIGVGMFMIYEIGFVDGLFQ